jgi:hypothetical protein
LAAFQVIIIGRFSGDYRGSDLARKLIRFTRAYSAHAKPFKWKYSDPSRHIGNLLFATRH